MGYLQMKRDFIVLFVIVVLLISFSSLSHAENKGKQLFFEVIAKAKKCSEGKSGSARSNCFIEATPKKCQPLVINFLSREEKDEAKRAWFFCIASCGDAGVWSKTF